MKNNILIFNVGSSSLRVGLYQKDSAAKYFFSVTNINSSHPIFKSEQKSFTLSKKISHLQAWLLIKKELDFYKQSNFSLVAHRIVYGDPGDQYGAIITDTKFKKLSKYVELAPLHQGSALQIIQWFKTKMPKLKQIAFFDTTFFNQLSASEKTLPLARAIRKMGVERRGFHGLSHHNCLQQVSKQENKITAKINMLSVHLGSGCSMAVIQHGQVVATTMSFTPNSGLMMMSRSGDIDSGIIFYLLKKRWPAKKINLLLNEDSGFKGLTGTANFEKFLLSYKKQPNQEKFQALASFVDQLAFAINGYLGLWPQTEYLVFTGGLGQNSELLRQMILSKVVFEVKTIVISAQEMDFIFSQCSKC